MASPETKLQRGEHPGLDLAEFHPAAKNRQGQWAKHGSADIRQWRRTRRVVRMAFPWFKR